MLITNQLTPALRSILREAGKSIARAEDFFLEKTKNILQNTMLQSLRTDLEPKGLSIDRVLSRSITLPSFIMAAKKCELLADARAYEILKLNETIAGNPAYLQLQATEALEDISRNPSSKIYFINGDSPQPLPLMNIGDVIK